MSYMALEMGLGLQVNVVQLLTARLALERLCALTCLLGHSRSNHSVLQSCGPGFLFQWPPLAGTYGSWEIPSLKSCVCHNTDGSGTKLAASLGTSAVGFWAHSLRRSFLCFQCHQLRWYLVTPSYIQIFRKIQWYFVGTGDFLTSLAGCGSSIFELADLSDSSFPMALWYFTNVKEVF